MNIEELENKIKNLTYIVIVGFIVLFILMVGLYFKDPTNNSTTTPKNEEVDSSYDTSRLTLLDKEKTKALVNSKGTKFLFVGRKGCGICQSILPNLNSVIDKLDIEVNYLSLDVSNWRTEYADIFDHLAIETTITDSTGTVNEGTYGELLNQKGFTPLVIVLKDGEMVDGFVGSRDADTIEEFFSKYL